MKKFLLLPLLAILIFACTDQDDMSIDATSIEETQYNELDAIFEDIMSLPSVRVQPSSTGKTTGLDFIPEGFLQRVVLETGHDEAGDRSAAVVISSSIDEGLISCFDHAWWNVRGNVIIYADKVDFEVVPGTPQIGYKLYSVSMSGFTPGEVRQLGGIFPSDHAFVDAIFGGTIVFDRSRPTPKIEEGYDVLFAKFNRNGNQVCWTQLPDSDYAPLLQGPDGYIPQNDQERLFVQAYNDGLNGFSVLGARSVTNHATGTFTFNFDNRFFNDFDPTVFGYLRFIYPDGQVVVARVASNKFIRSGQLRDSFSAPSHGQGVHTVELHNNNRDVLYRYSFYR